MRLNHIVRAGNYVRIDKMVAGGPLAHADDFCLDHPGPAGAVISKIRCSSNSRCAKLFDGGITPDVFIMYVELKRSDGQ
jgi:hypothetical protein